MKRIIARGPPSAIGPTPGPGSRLVVQLELTTSCGGPYWTPETANGAPIEDAGVIDSSKYYNRLGKQGWELLHVRNRVGIGRYELEYAPREALFQRLSDHTSISATDSTM